MTITRILKIQEHRIFQHFAWPDDLPAFAQFNLIYGWNATGKTTLSSLLGHLESRSAVTEGNVEFELEDGTSLLGSELATANLPPIRVFNSSFIESTILAAGEQMEPIYYLGKQSVEKRKRLATLQEAFEGAQTTEAAAASRKLLATTALDTFSIKTARVIKELLIGSNATKYNNYDKRSFKQAIERVTPESRTSELLTDERKRMLQAQKNAQPKNSLAAISVDVPNLNDLSIIAETLLIRSVVSEVIPELRDDTEVGTWVQHGLDLHAGDRHTEICWFCGQVFSGARREALEGHFNDAFADLQTGISAAEDHIAAARAIINDAKFPDSSRLYDHLANEYDPVVREYRSARDAVNRSLDAIRDRLTEKKHAPFQIMRLPDHDGVDPDGQRAGLERSVESVNGIIERHNRVSAKFQGEVDDACEQLEKHYVTEATHEYEQLLEAATTAHASLGIAIDTRTELAGKITALASEVIEYRRPAEELNAELRSYLGHDALAVSVKGPGYVITRSGRVATNLSEGEKTAIAFLYFLKSLEDKGFDSDKGIVVIDDPISSLDTNSLFSAFGFMKERTKDAAQLFVLTHNFGFFREVRRWFSDLRKRDFKDSTRGPAMFYLLRTSVENGMRTASLGPMDPLLRNYDSEYHFLFKMVHDVVNQPNAEVALQDYYPLPNIARRLLEAFLGFRYPDITNGLGAQLEAVTFDTAAKIRILRFLHSYSHSSGIAVVEDDATLLSETRHILHAMMNLMESVDPEHYEGLVRLIDPTRSDA